MVLGRVVVGRVVVPVLWVVDSHGQPSTWVVVATVVVGKVVVLFTRQQNNKCELNRKEETQLKLQTYLVLWVVACLATVLVLCRQKCYWTQAGAILVAVLSLLRWVCHLGREVVTIVVALHLVESVGRKVRAIVLANWEVVGWVVDVWTMGELAAGVHPRVVVLQWEVVHCAVVVFVLERAVVGRARARRWMWWVAFLEVDVW